MSDEENNHLSRKVVFGYGLPGITISLVIVLFIMYLPKYYTDVVGVDLQIIGLLILMTRIINALSDPFIGIISDRSYTRWGRRRPYIFVASIFLGLFFYLVTNPPVSLSASDSILWFGLFTLLMISSLSVMDVPYLSLGAEITKSYHERNILLGVRGFMQNLGVLLGPLLFILIGLYLGGDGVPLSREKFFYFGVVGASIIIFTCCYCVYSVKEQPLVDEQKPHAGLLSHFAVIKTNQPFRLLLIISSLQFMGMMTTASLFLFFTEYFLQSHYGDFVILSYTGSVIVGIPIWIYLARKLDKRKAMMLAIALNMIFLSNMIFIGPGDIVYYAMLVCCYGLTGGAVNFVLGPSMFADTIDYDEWKTGQRREGIHMGLMFMVGKIAMGVMVLLVFTVLDFLGHQSGKEQTNLVIQAIRWMFIGIPLVLGVMQVVMFYFYPITKEYHDKIRAEIDARQP